MADVRLQHADGRVVEDHDPEIGAPATNLIVLPWNESEALVSSVPTKGRGTGVIDPWPIVPAPFDTSPVIVTAAACVETTRVRTRAIDGRGERRNRHGIRQLRRGELGIA